MPKRPPAKPLGPLARRRLAAAGQPELRPKRKQKVLSKPLVVVYVLALRLPVRFATLETEAAD